jgi:lysosome membrane protein 2
MGTYVAGWTLAEVFADGGGLITTRTVNQWLFDFTYEEPLLLFLKEATQDPTFVTANNLFTNHTSENDPRIDPPDEFMTGSDNIDNVKQFVRWNGLSVVSGTWVTDEVITGTDATQFHPDVNKDETLKAFVSDILRVVDLVYKEERTVEGIDLYRFILANSVLGLNANYYQSIRGLANMTSAIGAPLFLSKPHFLDAEAGKTSALVTGLSQNREEHDTFIDVEPLTGATLSARKRLQLNFNVTQGNLVYTAQKQALIPLAWVEEGADITPGQAKDFKDAIYGAQNLQQLATIGGPAIGIILLLTAAFIGIRARTVKP